MFSFLLLLLLFVYFLRRNLKWRIFVFFFFFLTFDDYKRCFIQMSLYIFIKFFLFINILFFFVSLLFFKETRNLSSNHSAFYYVSNRFDIIKSYRKRLKYQSTNERSLSWLNLYGIYL